MSVDKRLGTKFCNKKKKRDWSDGERQNRSFGCVDHGQSESVAWGYRRLHRTIEGYIGLHRATQGNTRQHRATH